MRTYQKNRPLIAIHVPKSGGTSFYEILKKGFGRKLYKNYYDEKRVRMPRRVRLNKHWGDEYRCGVCVYGHFNKDRGFGIPDLYPDVDQFITVLRDPFELAVSEYFFLRKVAGDWRDQSRVPRADLAKYLSEFKTNMLNHFPVEMTIDNCTKLLHKHFIHIGITEDMETSANLIAAKLGFERSTQIRRLNVTERTKEVPYELKEKFMANNPVEYAVYNFALENYDKL